MRRVDGDYNPEACCVVLYYSLLDLPLIRWVCWSEDLIFHLSEKDSRLLMTTLGKAASGLATVSAVAGLFAAGLCVVVLCWGRLVVFFSMEDINLVDPASSHTLVSKIKPCMSKYARPVQ